MYVKLKTKSGHRFKEYVPGNLTIQEARNIFENDYIIVTELEEEKYGDFDNNKAISIIENEGIGYAVMNYCSYKEFTDPETRKLWRLADESLQNLKSHLNID